MAWCGRGCLQQSPRMTFSVLLPTRNRLEYLRHAVDSVLRQDDPDWEIVISDNDSEEDIAGYVASLADERVRYARTASFVPVTENWNNALRQSTGAYFVMLGDDDALLPGYFTAMREHIRSFDEPDAIYHGALLYTYPGVDAAEPRGSLKDYGYASFLRGAERPFVLPRATARGLVREAMDFKVRFGFNMQFACVSRAIADRIAGDGEFFRSPFPDYFAMNMLMLRAASIVADPEPRVVIGVTPRSYGFFHANKREREARSFLEGAPGGGAAPDDADLLPGTNINNGWLQAMEAVSAAAGDPGLRPSRRRYRMLQSLYVYEHHRFGEITDEQLRELQAHLGRGEKLAYGAAFGAASAAARVLPARARALARTGFALAQRQTPYWRPGQIPGSYRDMAEVLDAFDGDRPPGAATHGKPPDCPGCGSATHLRLTAYDRNRSLSDERFPYWECGSCGTLFLAPVPQDIGRFYPSDYYALPASRNELARISRPHEAYKIDLLRPLAARGRLVEVGPGIGGFAALAQDAGYEVEVIEMDARASAFLRDTVGVKVHETDDPATALRREGPFDVIAMWHVIEHLPDPFDALRAVAAALAPGGVAVIAAPNPEALQFRLFGGRWTHLDAPRHLFLIPVPALLEAAAALGLEVLQVTTTDAGTLAWNRFGWRETLAHSFTNRYPAHALRLLGTIPARLAQPLERRGRRGATYTVALRRPAS
jgi:2-polyprenyl-3-methyl-5-hydroxy-6-metoxy-1,4-benzoquinol methylase